MEGGLLVLLYIFNYMSVSLILAYSVYVDISCIINASVLKKEIARNLSKISQ